MAHALFERSSNNVLASRAATGFAPREAPVRERTVGGPGASEELPAIRRTNLPGTSTQHPEPKSCQQRRQSTDSNDRKRAGGAWQFRRRRLGNGLTHWFGGGFRRGRQCGSVQPQAR